MRRSHFSGCGLHTHLGQGLAANVAALRLPPPAPTAVAISFGNATETVPCHLLAGTPLDGIETRGRRALEAVVAEALAAAQLTRAELRETALFVGTSSFDIGATEAVYRRELAAGEDAHPLTVNSPMGNVAQQLRETFVLGGPDYTFNTACTSSANALLYADGLLRSGRIEHALIVGVETFNLVTALGFQGLELLAPRGMKPFDRERGGLVLGEGCSALVISSRARAHDMNVTFRGGANLCDTYGVSAANPDGSTVAALIDAALAAAGTARDEIAAVKTHGTASLLNDEAEAAGMLHVFTRPPPLIALKPFIGHTFGACELNELLLFCGAAAAQILPGTPGIAATPGELGVELNQHLTALGAGVFLMSYFGFGGNNTALVIANA